MEWTEIRKPSWIIPHHLNERTRDGVHKECDTQEFSVEAFVFPVRPQQKENDQGICRGHQLSRVQRSILYTQSQGVREGQGEGEISRAHLTEAASRQEASDPSEHQADHYRRDHDIAYQPEVELVYSAVYDTGKDGTEKASVKHQASFPELKDP